MKGTNIFKHPIFYALGVVVIIMCVLVARSDTVRGDLFGGKKVAFKKVEGSKSASFIQDANAAGLGPLGKKESDAVNKNELVKKEEVKKPENEEKKVLEVGDRKDKTPIIVENDQKGFTSEKSGRTRPDTILTVKKGPEDLVSLKCVGNNCIIENPSGKL